MIFGHFGNLWSFFAISIRSGLYRGDFDFFTFNNWNIVYFVPIDISRNITKNVKSTKSSISPPLNKIKTKQILFLPKINNFNHFPHFNALKKNVLYNLTRLDGEKSVKFAEIDSNWSESVEGGNTKFS